MEFDLVQFSHEWEWCVSHGGGCNEAKSLLSTVLSELSTWMVENPEHDPITVHLDLKSQPRDDGVFPTEFDRYIEAHFDALKLYLPRDLMGVQPDLMRGARHNGWLTLSSLKGKVLFCLSGRKATKARYAAIKPKERLCFADQEVGVRENTWRPPLDRGDRVFFNFYLTHSKVQWVADLAWYANEPGVISRAYVLNDVDLWTSARQSGVSILSTDLVSNVSWAGVGNEAFARRCG